MQTFTIITLGCKVNQCESQLLREQLASLGLREAAPGEPADLGIVNTCAVTATAQGKSVRALRKLRREHPRARVAAVGCGVSASPERYSEADIALPQDEKHLTVRKILGRDSAIGTTSGFQGHARAFMKIQDGCDSFCSYCIVPHLRGGPRSRPLEEIRREAGAIAANGYRELVLTGIHLGLYGRDLGDGVNLVSVVEMLLKADLFPRLRLSGVEVHEVTDRLIELVTGENALCAHLHIPLQSGSAKVLRDMKRSYTPDEYLGLIEKARKSQPQISVTTDVIVGFPTETATHFEETLEVCRKAGFSRMHVFPYSRREGTTAAKKWKSGAVADISARAKTLRALAAELAGAYARQFAGESVRVLVESHIGGPAAEGYTDHYLRAGVCGTRVPPGELVQGIVTAVRGSSLKVESMRTGEMRTAEHSTLARRST
jgi:threonylcarbamoyladenosine tRNA methylthiotransferase MtaB